ncbi:MAG: transcription-repair coupling factor [Clostridia bacterium]|nr:transcription-repair coupling factor [Clostridia bacterium]
MHNQGIIDIIRGSEQFHNIAGGLQQGLAELQLYGLPEGLKGIWLAALALDHYPILFVTTGSDEAQRLVADLETFWPDSDISYLPSAELLPVDINAYSPELTAQRLQALLDLVRGRTRVLVVAADTLLHKLPPPQLLRQSILSFETGQVVDPQELVQQLVARGYRREQIVEAPGQFAVRGGIIDIFPMGVEAPIRLEFFDNEIDSMRYFDLRTQRSVEEIGALIIGPAQEVLLPPDLEPGLTALRAEINQVQQKLGTERKGAIAELSERMERMISQLEMGICPAGIGQLQAYFYPLATLFDYFKRRPLVVLNDPVRLQEELRRREELRLGLFTEMLNNGQVLPSQGQIYLELAELERLWPGYQRLYLSLLPRRAPGTSPQRLVSIGAQNIPSFQGKIGLLVEELSRWRREGYRTVVMAADPNRIAALRQGLADQGIEAQSVAEVATLPARGQVLIAPGRLREGFTWPELRLAVLGDTEIYGAVKRPRRPRPSREGSKISSFTELQEGDYVVHVHHGIGRYQGLQQLEAGGVKKDYLLIQYAGKDRLYVPIDQVHLVQKYVGAEGHVPRLYRLGGNEWQRVKSRVQESIQAMAEELIQLYAKRETMPGYAFSADTPWQREFEEAFPYTETPDQLKAIAEVKKDMEQPRPMDRLLCGDVGYGKTEVAMRAAFKAVMDGKQVALLVPTTILAQQHYNTFKERFAPFPVKLAMLSRFCSPKEQKRVVKALKNGQIDIVIGTHRLLSADVSFNDLGLVIVDEEQRFGVAHKEKLKRLCTGVDVLTMTATPIPRTLHMAIAGVRQMSLIETPPEDRFPVQTYVVEYSPELVREVIRRELERGGQVYFVHNRVNDIERYAYHIQQLVPEARVGIGHGQMNERELERVMVDFIEDHFDILVCTTIVENGLDIPNVNTLIVNESDSFGLAQLYQLRGRVGRTNRLAYAYFTYRPDKVLGELAEKRLAAIREFTAFGSGYKIALRDLQIRGAGNLLGPEQHGHMLAVGFDLYCQLLEEAVQKLKKQQGEEVPTPPPAPVRTVPVELMVDTFLNDDYIPVATLKMEFYQRLMQAERLAEINEIADEMVDRFGPLPPPAQNLLTMTRVRLLAQEVGINSIQQKGREIELKLGQHCKLRGDKLLQLPKYFPRKLAFSSAGGLTIKLRIGGLGQQEILHLLGQILERIKYLVMEAVS